MEKYSNSGQKWSEREDEQLIRLYNVEKLNIGEICKQHKRCLGGITSRLQKNGIFPSGYKEFINTEKYKSMKNQKKPDNSFKKK